MALCARRMNGRFPPCPAVRSDRLPARRKVAVGWPISARSGSSNRSRKRTFARLSFEFREADLPNLRNGWLAVVRDRRDKLLVFRSQPSSPPLERREHVTGVAIELGTIMMLVRPKRLKLPLFKAELG